MTGLISATQVKMVEKLAKKWDPLQIGIESNAYQKALKQPRKHNAAHKRT
ncbi:MAG: hypothetical protein Q7U35_04620 [Methanobacteriaceae archaeon]|nr:hypothetical protein [Methanobacteriaceae archaeon]